MNEHNYKTWSGSLAKENIRLKKWLGLSWLYFMIDTILDIILWFASR